MKVTELLKIANNCYPDGDGDGLARFIASEIKSVHDPKASTAAQRLEIILAMARASRQLREVAKGFQELLFDDGDLTDLFAEASEHHGNKEGTEAQLDAAMLFIHSDAFAGGTDLDCLGHPDLNRYLQEHL